MVRKYALSLLCITPSGLLRKRTRERIPGPCCCCCGADDDDGDAYEYDDDEGHPSVVDLNNDQNALSFFKEALTESQQKNTIAQGSNSPNKKYNDKSFIERDSR